LKKYFVTAKEDLPLIDLIEAALPKIKSVQAVIESGGAWLENRRVFNPNTIIRKGGTITVMVSRFQGRQYRLEEKNIVFETREIIALYKPSGVNVQSDYSTVQYNLSYGLETLLKARGERYVPSPVTRLDLPVSGLVLYAKNKNAEQELFKLTRDRKIRKQYVAIVERNVDHKCLRVRDKLGFRKGKASLDKFGKSAHSLFIKREEIGGYDVFSTFIFTGRRHQIRFHASKYLSPILGDVEYGSESYGPQKHIGLFASGYNIPFRGRNYRIRLSDIGDRVEIFVNNYLQKKS